MKFQRGFTLAELLIALAILGVIAVFTIPKVLQSQQDSRNKSIAKEAAGALSQAYQQYNLDAGVSSSTKTSDLAPYFNYVRYDTVSTIDHDQGNGTLTCTSASPCLQLHNGAVLRLTFTTFNGTGATNAIGFSVDPDGKVTDGTTNGPGKSVQFYLYYDGRLTTRGTVLPNTVNSSLPGGFGPNPSEDPPWFSWN